MNDDHHGHTGHTMIAILGRWSLPLKTNLMKCHRFFSMNMVNTYDAIWKFPKIGLRPNQPSVKMDFPWKNNKPSSYWDTPTPIYGNHLFFLWGWTSNKNQLFGCDFRQVCGELRASHQLTQRGRQPCRAETGRPWRDRKGDDGTCEGHIRQIWHDMTWTEFWLEAMQLYVTVCNYVTTISGFPHFSWKTWGSEKAPEKTTEISIGLSADAGRVSPSQASVADVGSDASIQLTTTGAEWLGSGGCMGRLVPP